jgi:hypothetical protein
VTEVEQDEKMYLRHYIPVPPFIALMLIDHTKDEDAHQLGSRIVLGIGSIKQDVDHELHRVVTSAKGKQALRAS